MTAFGMGYSALKEVEVGAESQLAPPEQSPSTGGAEWRDRLLTFIPGDIVGGYTLIAAMIPDEIEVAWAVAIIFTLLSPFVVFWGLSVKADEVDTRIPRSDIPWFRIFAAPISFAAWVFALPGSPADSFGDQNGWMKPAVLVLVAIVISGLAKKYDRAPVLA
ncbi:hypothetical protein OG921_04565 [Aldersonia sp. NBC_00410]|uniref:hypothetical protein n=1 Tax=Aldersonia sp. NBC_00410 TaxID=2975954 RepID=UPI00225537F0|nr:hypothetical protein [Aldersonia sp. NBC_00410]MCX5042447.1 hypothetical protein [Aldersonia sp. NBC_00410]